MLLGGPVAHIVLPNNSPEHWHFGPQWAHAFPDAVVYAAPGLEDHLEFDDGRAATVLTNEAPAAWAGQIDQALMVDPLFKEVVFCHRKSKTLLVRPA
eukprot:885186-Prorocentrum_minimum.AAC.1